MANEHTPQSDLNVGDSVFKLDLPYIESVLRYSEKDDKLVVESFKTTPLTKKGDNYSSIMLAIEVTASLTGGKTGEKKDFHLVGKLAPSNKVRLYFNKLLGFFPKENFMCNFYIPMLIALQKKRGVSDVLIPEVPRIFSPPDEKEMVLIFQNVSSDGYKMSDKMNGCSYEEVKLVMTELGRFHALSYAFVQEHKRKFPDIPLTENYSELVDGMKKEEAIPANSAWITQSVDSTVKLILQETEKRPDHSELTAKLNKYVGKGGEMHYEMLDREHGLMAVILGDCWINNMMFKYENGRPVAVKLLDLQLSRLTSFSRELNSFVYTSIGNKVRQKHLTDLLDIYYNELQNTWKKINEKVQYTREDLQREFNSYKSINFLYCLAALPAMLARPEDAINYDDLTEADLADAEAMKRFTAEAKSKMGRNEHLITRLIDVVDEMNRDGVI